MNSEQAATIAASRRPRRLSRILAAALAGTLLVYGMSALVGNTGHARGFEPAEPLAQSVVSVRPEAPSRPDVAAAAPAADEAGSAAPTQLPHLDNASSDNNEALSSRRTPGSISAGGSEPVRRRSNLGAQIERAGVMGPGVRRGDNRGDGGGVGANDCSDVGVSGCAHGPAAIRTAAADAAALRDLAKGQLANFLIHAEPQELPDFGFVDETGARHTLAEFRGQLVLLNLWATWCGPCRSEMPAFDQLKRDFDGRPFAMLAISVDRGGLKKPRRFFDEVGIKDLTLYGDEDGRLASRLRSFAMPTTLLIGPDGRELGRLAGPAEWASPDALAFLEAAMKQAGVGGKG
jgi:thiol-disulfide isomerase/thioredoxin